MTLRRWWYLAWIVILAAVAGFMLAQPFLRAFGVAGVLFVVAGTWQFLRARRFEREGSRERAIYPILDGSHKALSGLIFMGFGLWSIPSRNWLYVVCGLAAGVAWALFRAVSYVRNADEQLRRSGHLGPQTGAKKWFMHWWAALGLLVGLLIAAFVIPKAFPEPIWDVIYYLCSGYLSAWGITVWVWAWMREQQGYGRLTVPIRDGRGMGAR